MLTPPGLPGTRLGHARGTGSHESLKELLRPLWAGLFPRFCRSLLNHEGDSHEDFRSACVLDRNPGRDACSVNALAQPRLRRSPARAKSATVARWPRVYMTCGSRFSTRPRVGRLSVRPQCADNVPARQRALHGTGRLRVRLRRAREVRADRGAARCGPLVRRTRPDSLRWGRASGCPRRPTRSSRRRRGARTRSTASRGLLPGCREHDHRNTLGFPTQPQIVALSGSQTFTGIKTFGTAPAFTGAGAPFTVSSSTKVTNLNADKLDGLDSSAFLQSIPNPLNLTGSNASQIIGGTKTSTNTPPRAWPACPRRRPGRPSCGLFESQSTQGRGIWGFASATTGTTYGVIGER